MTRLANWTRDRYPQAVPARLLSPRYSLAAGWLASALLAICCVSGLLLAFHFRASANEAYASVADITSVVEYGWLLRDTHRFAAEGLLVVAGIHLLRVLLGQAYTGPRKANWLAGVGLLGLVLLANLTGYLLPWDQTAYWGLSICVSMLDATPLAGPALRQLLAGSLPLDGTCLPRVYAMHAIVLPAGLLLLAAYHRKRFRRDVTTHAINASDSTETVPGRPDLWYWELAALFGAMAMLAVAAVHLDAPLAGPANPLEPPNPAKAPWYFLWLQELASHVPAGAAAAIATGLFGLLALVPWLTGGASGSHGSQWRARVTTAACLAIGVGIVAMDVIGWLFRGANWSFVVPWR